MTATDPSALADVKETSFDLVSLNHPRSKYTVEQKVQACTYYVSTGRIKDVALMTGVPAATISSWKRSAAWWDETCAEIKITKNEELESLLTHSLHMASEAIVDRLTNGNEVLVDGENGEKELRRVKVPARELSQLTNTLFEKRQLLRGQATSTNTTAKVDFTDLAKQFKQLSKEFTKSHSGREDVNNERATAEKVIN